MKTSTYSTSLVAMLLFGLLLSVRLPVAATTIGEAKFQIPDGNVVLLESLLVTASFAGLAYVEEAGRCAGIGVQTTAALAVGNVVDVMGRLATDPLNEERYLVALPGYPVVLEGDVALAPLRMGASAFVGGACGLQKGMPDATGLNTVGLLVTICGPVKQLDSTPYEKTWFTIADPSGVEIKVVVPQGVNLDGDWAMVEATGICSLDSAEGGKIRVLRARRQEDIIPLRSRADIRVKSMTLDEKIGQLFHVRFDGDEVTESMRQTIQSKHIGGVIYFQYNGNLNDPVRSARFSNDLQSCAIGEDGDGIPLLISMDQEGGRVTRITGGTHFPGNMALGAARSAELAEAAGRVLGLEIRAVGGNMDLAPVLDVNNNPANPVIGVRSFGEQPALAADLGRSYVDGLHFSGVMAVGKHFPGHGDTSVDSHTGLPVVDYDYEILDTIHGQPFREAVQGGMDAVMTAHIVVTCLDPYRPATLSRDVIEGYLRGELGFEGVVMTDSMGMAGITAGYSVEQAAVMAVKAGVDILLLPPDLDRAFAAIRSAVLGGEITEARIDQSVVRILKMKHRAGVFSAPYVNADAAADIVGCEEHWASELEAARAAATLVQNAESLLPLSLNAEQQVLLVCVQSSETTGDAAARFAFQLSARHPSVESIGISTSPGSSERSTVVDAAEAADVVIIGTSRAQLYPRQATLVEQLVATGKPVIAVGLREPYELASFPGVNAYIAIYNYRDCGFQAAAEAIFGELSPTGLLPVTIPGQYPFGHGLSYQ